MERKIWKPVINILKAPEKNEHLTLIFILNGSQLVQLFHIFVAG